MRFYAVPINGSTPVQHHFFTNLRKAARYARKVDQDVFEATMTKEGYLVATKTNLGRSETAPTRRLVSVS